MTNAYSNPKQIKFYCKLSGCVIQTVWMSLANMWREESMENGRGRTMFIAYVDRTHLSLYVLAYRKTRHSISRRLDNCCDSMHGSFADCNLNSGTGQQRNRERRTEVCLATAVVNVLQLLTIHYTQPQHLNFYMVNLLLPAICLTGVRGGAVGWGTALQVGRSRVRFPMVSLDFSLT